MKVSEVSGAALDMLVATAQGAKIEQQSGGPTWMVDGAWLSYVRSYHPSTDWEQGGPIIDKYHIHVSPHTYGPASVVCNSWHAIIGFDPDGGEHLYEADGPTALIAIMRCFVLSELGDEVEFLK